MEKTKSAIIGRVWVNSSNDDILPSFITLNKKTTFGPNESYNLLNGSLTFKTDRNLNASSVEGEYAPVVMEAGSRLNFYSNPKRADHQDPDMSASGIFVEEVANTIINNSKRATEAWKTSNSL